MYFTFSCLVNLATRLWNIARVLLQKVDELAPPQAFEKQNKQICQKSIYVGCNQLLWQHLQEQNMAKCGSSVWNNKLDSQTKLSLCQETWSKRWVMWIIDHDWWYLAVNQLGIKFEFMGRFKVAKAEILDCVYW